MLRAGLVGCGNLGRVHTEALAQLGEMRMVAFCDAVPERAKAFLHRYGGDYATEDPERLFRDQSLDAVYVCTQHDSHAALCVRAAEAGKHVFVEKPLALTVEDCLRVARTVERTGIKLMTGFKMRYYELVRKARELIPQPLVATMQMMDNTWAPDHWANDPVRGGGNVLSQGCHACDLIRYVAGADPVEVYAAGGNYYQPTGVVDNLCATFRMANGAAVSWVQGDAHCPPVTSKFFMQLFAPGRSVTLMERFCTLVYAEAGKEPRTFKGTETGFVEENRAFIECIQKATPSPIDHRDGLWATLMVLQAFRSLESGRPEPIASLVAAV